MWAAADQARWAAAELLRGTSASEMTGPRGCGRRRTKRSRGGSRRVMAGKTRGSPGAGSVQVQAQDSAAGRETPDRGRRAGAEEKKVGPGGPAPRGLTPSLERALPGPPPYPASRPPWGLRERQRSSRGRRVWGLCPRGPVRFQCRGCDPETAGPVGIAWARPRTIHSLPAGPVVETERSGRLPPTTGLGGKEVETSMMREPLIGCLLHVPTGGIKPATRAPSVRSPALSTGPNQLGRGLFFF
ncbi:hypothetical protein D623_10015281 [Myotis brandtii]|uniref:Uncharacterized protein n=1 Tax=Myotis brandtii TaxID=109478 RepID=S7N8M9_MYOBR|nr:hypothetical protein D623_10015281 [Myotis brandtii]